MDARMSFFRPSSVFLVAFGTGLCVGAGSTYLYYRLNNKYSVDLQKISRSIAELKAEISEMKANMPQRRRRPIPAFYSSSGETDDEAYEDALDRNTDNEENVPPDGSEEGSDINLYRDIDVLFDGDDDDKKKAYSKLLDDYNDENLTDAVFLWRLAKSMYQVSQIEGANGNDERKKDLIFSALDIAKKALIVGDNCANAHKWYAITLGSVGEYQSTQDKIKNGYTFKEHIEKAIKLNPNDSSNHHLLGRWCYGVYMLSWLERKAAAALYASPPTATAEEALQHFLEADRLNPGKWKENLLYIGKCYVQMSKYPEAVSWLQKAADLPPESDKAVEDEIQSLLTKYKR